MVTGSRLRGTLAASVTPLREGGTSVDIDAIGDLVDFYVRAGLDGLLALGTTGEGILLAAEERRETAERFLSTAAHRIPIIVHCGAQTTRDTSALAEHAARNGAAGVAVIPPPYFALDADALWRHLDAAASACAPTPFYVYEFAARSGYPVPIAVVERLRTTAANLAGLKVSDAPFERVEPYLLPGLDVFIGAEGLIHQGLARGAAGAVSGLAAALPELTIAAVTSTSPEASARAARARTAIEHVPFLSALKFILRRRGVGIDDVVRPPLPTLNASQRQTLHALIDDAHGEIAAVLNAGVGPGGL